MARQSELLAAVPVLLTRPKADGEGFAAAITSRFGSRVRPVVAPLLAPRYLSPAIPPTPFAGVIFTSSHGVEGAVRLGVPLPKLAWCVGKRTAAVAAAAGFQARSADGDADSLVEAILTSPPNGRLLYLRGVDTRGNILERLGSFCVYTDVAEVYVQDPQPLTPEALTLLSSVTPLVIPLFSPRTAALFRKAVPKVLQADLHIAAMSSAVVEALDGLPAAATVIARSPDGPAMLDAIESLLTALPAP